MENRSQMVESREFSQMYKRLTEKNLNIIAWNIVTRIANL